MKFPCKLWRCLSTLTLTPLTSDSKIVLLRPSGEKWRASVGLAHDIHFRFRPTLEGVEAPLWSGVGLSCCFKASRKRVTWGFEARKGALNGGGNTQQSLSANKVWFVF